MCSHSLTLCIVMDFFPNGLIQLTWDSPLYMYISRAVRL